MLKKLKNIKHKKIIALVIFIALIGASYFSGVLQFHSDRATYDYGSIFASDESNDEVNNETTNLIPSKFRRKVAKSTTKKNNDSILTSPLPSTTKKKDSDTNDSILDQAAGFIEDSIEDIEIISDKKVNITYDFYNIQFNCDNGSFDYINYKPTSRYNLSNSQEDITIEHNFLHKQIIKECNYNRKQVILMDSKKDYSNALFVKGEGIASHILEHNSSQKNNEFYRIKQFPLHIKQSKKGGFWHYTDKIIGCYQKNNNVEVYTGNVWDDRFLLNDSLKDTNGIMIPEFLYKIVILNQKDVYAWIIENNEYAVPRNEKEHLFTISDIENLANIDFYAIPDNLKNIKSKETAGVLTTCK